MRILTRQSAVWTSVCLSLLLASCSGDGSTGPRKARPPVGLQIVSGDTQIGAAGEELGAPIVARVVDAGGQPVPGQIVNFVVTQGGGSVFAGGSISDGNGIVREYWTLGTRASDAQELEARAVNPSTGEKIVFGVFHADALGGRATSLSISGGNGQNGTSGSPLSAALSVAGLDRFGNVAELDTVTWTAAPGSGSASPASSAMAGGSATTTWTLGGAGPNTLVAQSRGGATATFAATAAAAPGGVIPAYVYVDPQYNGGDRLGTQIQLVARGIDVDGNPLSGLTFTWGSDNPNVATVDQNGVLRFVAVGWTNISVTAGGKSAYRYVNVVP